MSEVDFKIAVSRLGCSDQLNQYKDIAGGDFFTYQDLSAYLSNQRAKMSTAQHPTRSSSQSVVPDYSDYEDSQNLSRIALKKLKLRAKL